jgi:3-oxoacyl-[acyl-carrier protein] reductase
MGGTRGIGREVALTFAKHGARVAVCGRNARCLAAIADEFSAREAQHYVASFDVGEREEVGAFISTAASAIGGIDVPVNCASALATSDSEMAWMSSVSVDLLGTIRTCQAAEQYLGQSSNGCIINVASISGVSATPTRPAYGETKAAVLHYSTTLALRLADQRIRVNCVVPGSTDSDGGIWQRIRRENPDLYERTKARIPFGRFARPSDIANAIVFFASDQARWITGQSLVVDGGQTLHGF